MTKHSKRSEDALDTVTEKKDKRVKGVVALNEYQKLALKTIHENQITIIHGPAGTGKTHIAVLYGLQRYCYGEYDKLIFTRPCVEAYGESLGYLPGDQSDKIAPYMMPIFDLLETRLTVKEIEGLLKSNKILTLPLAFQRGVTFNNSYVVLDEAQNTRVPQMRLFLTRLGKNSKIIITGDLLQSDIQGVNGLGDAIDRFKGTNGIGIVDMPLESNVRNPLIETIERKYAEKRG